MVGLAVSSGGFTSVSADRTTKVAVVDDEHAYLGIADKLQCGAGNGIGQNRNVVVNRFPGTTLDAVTVRAAIPNGESGELRIGPRGSTEQIGAGESTEFELDGPLTSGESATVQVKPPTGTVSATDTLVFEHVHASGTGIEVAVDDRTVDVDCPAGTDKGGGNG